MEQLARIFENSTHEKKVIVEAFGNEAQREHFKKYRKFKTKSVENALLTTLRQYFYDLEVVANPGKASKYKLGSAKEEKSERESGRETNGNYKSYTKHLDALVLSHLELELKNDYEFEKSVTNWMSEFNMINKNSHQLYKSKYNSYLADESKKIIEIQANINESLARNVYQFYLKDINKQKEVFLNTLNRLKKHNIIETFERPKAYLSTPLKGEDELEISVVDVSTSMYQQYTNKKRELREKHGITTNQLEDSKFTTDKKIIEKKERYNEELSEFLSDIEIVDTYNKKINVSVENIWMNLAIIVKATRPKIMDYLHKFNPEALREYQHYKHQEFHNSQVTQFRENRKSERLKDAVSKKKFHLEKVTEADEKFNAEIADSRRFGRKSSKAELVKSDAPAYIKAIEALDEVFGDKFIIDEKRLGLDKSS